MTDPQMAAPTAPATPEPPRDAEGQFARVIEQAEIDAEAARLRSLGMSYREIARQMSCDPTTARDRVIRALAAVPVEAVHELRALEGARLDSYMQRALLFLNEEHVVTIRGEVLLDSKGKPVQDRTQNLAALRELRLLSERRSKLLGIDMPTEMRLTVTDEMQAEIEQMIREARAAGVEIVDPTRAIES